MTRDFEGKTEQDAINQAIEALHIEREDFDVEILDNGKRGLFKKANVKIRVHIDSDSDDEKDSKPFIPSDDSSSDSDYADDYDQEEEEDLEPNEELEQKVCEFIDQMVSHMGYESKTTVSSRKGRKVNLEITSESSSIIIGRKGKNLDAIQVLANVYAGKIDTERKIIVDSEGYRLRHEEQIIKTAYRTAMQVRKTGRSRLLEPMNPYERRLVHTALNDVTGIETKSEGEGLYKQVRVISKRKRY
ncbi:MAG: Jag N-terminal domain-containing protein [Spirochaetales bacterium]|nr:Jag N-terminal domain-containing protein [Spirochaetales bacterium]